MQNSRNAVLDLYATDRIENERCGWYLIRTKQYKESLVQNVLGDFVSDTFLPLLRTTNRQWGRIASVVAPLFPCYLFSLFDLDTTYQRITRTPGVVGLVREGGGPAEVPSSIVEEIRRRGPNGIVELPKETLHPGQQVQVEHPLFNGFTAVFERYLSGTERVALLLNAVSGARVRIVMPASRVLQCG
jgi:transcriptional antiterminator RfaH